MTMTTNPEQVDETYTFGVRSDGFCIIQVEGELTSHLTEEIAGQMHRYVEQNGRPSGSLLDMRRCAPLSMIRLSGLLDAVSGTSAPLAVVFLWRQQQELATLLHHTLQHHERVGYFVDLADAWTFLEKPAL
jgi:hypothetical protein